MDLTSLGLIVTATFFHAYWNYLLKRAQGEIVFLWGVACASGVMFFPLWYYQVYAGRAVLNPETLAVAAVSGFLNVVFLFVLQHGFRSGEMSIVFPVSRGSGALFSIVLGLLVLHETLTPLCVAGSACAVAGVLVPALSNRRGGGNSHEARGTSWGIAAGFCLALLTFWLKYSVSSLDLDPSFIAIASNVVPSIYLLPIVLKRRAVLRETVRGKYKDVLGVTFFNNVSYIILVIAVQRIPLVYFAPARELSILFGLFLSFRFLREKFTAAKAVSASLILAGVVLLSVR